MEPISIALGLASLTGLDKKIGRWLGGDNGAQVASKVIEIAQSVTGFDNPADIRDVLSADSGAVLAFEERLHDQEHELEKLAYADRADAREMQESALSQDDPVAKRFIYYFAAFWSLAAVVYIGLITFVDIPKDSVRFADTILGFLLGTVVATIIGFFFGASVSPQSQSGSGLGPSQGASP